MTVYKQHLVHSVRWTTSNGRVLLHPELSRPDAPLLRGPLIGHAKWHSRQESNLQPAVLETAAPSLELREYKNRPWNPTSRVYTHAPRSKLRSGGHIKTAPVRRRGCWLAHILSGKLHLDKDSKAFSWHGRLHARPCGLSSPCALWCETVDSNHAEGEVRTLPQTLRAAALNGAVPKSRIEAARET